ncbi:hypothetical protein NIES2100_05180 [Calothrix sp. NIES-2100]|uniref:ATPase/DNA packaging protein n=1 Tax=Calothrix sp. NIES-2100 TaxID=1954172 RepID=UPI000B611E7A|nr:hypothetical protein NIES2100_05180 [Calothrix sp. NIES-2100]
MNPLKQIKKQRDNTAKLAFCFAGISIVSMYTSMSDVKYDTVDFCFIPEVLHSTPRSEFCKNGQDIFRTSPKFLLKKDELKPNPEFVTGNDKFLIPATGRHIVNFNKATNPNYLFYAIAAVGLSTVSYGLYSLTSTRYKREFPELFEQYKTETLEAQLIGLQSRETTKYRTVLETQYIQENIESEFQSLRMMDMSDEQKLAYQEYLQEQSRKQKLIENSSFDLDLARLKAEKFKHDLESKTSEKKMERLDQRGYEPNLEKSGNGSDGSSNSSDNFDNQNDSVQGSNFDVAKSEQDTRDMIKSLVKSDGSTVIIGQQGSGKSSFVKEYLRQLKDTYTEFDARVFSVKNDSYEGLREQDCCYRFIGDDKIQEAQEFFNDIKTEYERRLSLDEDRRNNLKPFIVLLDDWISSAIALDEADVQYSQLLLDILIIGREYNVKFVAILHSLNLKAIGIKELDQSTRSCLNLVLLGNKYIKDNREMESYKVIETALNLPQAVPDKKDRDNLREQYKNYKVVSQRLKQPVVFAYLGHYYLGIVPKF